jgi:hypothetical protein
VPNDEMIYNWSNKLRNTSASAEKLAAVEAASRLKKRGFSADDALDIMIADQYNVRSAEAAIAEVFSARKAAPTYPTKTKAAMVVPTSYDEMAPVVEQSLQRMSSREFVDKLTKGNSPLIEASQNTLHSWYRLAQYAKIDGYALQQLHAALKPHLANVLYNAVLAAESPKSQMRIASSEGNRYVVAAAQGTVNVDLSAGTCTCNKYVSNNYSDFGLACEHLVRVADTISPHQRLVKAMRSE